MAYINKTVSCEVVLAKVQRTFKPQGSSWIREAIENIGWAIQDIGYHCNFEDRSSDFPYLKVTNNRAKIPCDVERILVVERLLPGNRFAENVLNDDGTTPFPTQIQDQCIFHSHKLVLGSDLTGGGITETSPRTTRIRPRTPYYILNDDYIVTSFTTGLLKLHYKGFPVTKEGFPKILDEASYKMACEWYVIANMLLGGYKHPELTWKIAHAMYEDYRYKAENAPKMPSVDGAESFRSSWTRYVQNANIATDYFMNHEQRVYISEE